MRPNLVKQSLQYSIVFRRYCTKPASPSATSPTPAAKQVSVTGLSPACVGKNEPVGPGASVNGEYKVPEYFNYNKMTYFEAEVEMAKYRCPQPNAGRK